MKFVKFIYGVMLLLATATFMQTSQAQTLQVLTAGSSAQWGVFAAAAYQLALSDIATGGGAAGGHAYHYSVKGTCSSVNCAELTDSVSSVPAEGGNLWIVWDTTSSGSVFHIWSYLSVDSVVGDRAFFRGDDLELASTVASASVAGQNALSVWSDGSIDVGSTVGTVTGPTFSASDFTTVATDINAKPLTAANTDIRPEDGLFATWRALAPACGTACNPLTPNTFNLPTTGNDYVGLGYADTSVVVGGVTTYIGFGIESYLSQTAADAFPVSFSLGASTSWTTIPVGAAPIVIIANNANTSGLGSTAVTNATSTELAELFDGTNCDSSVLGQSPGVDVNPILREPTSGTMNTFEFTNVRTSGTDSQERKVLGGAPGSTNTSNPLHLGCDAGGTRYRAVGTGDEVNLVKNTSATGGSGQTLPTEDQIGYVFFSYEGVSGSNLKYLKLGGIDPLNTTYPTGGTLPTCTSTRGPNSFTENWCPGFTPGSKFENLRNGDYSSWSTYRIVTAPSGDNFTNAKNLVVAAQEVAALDLPDFVPFEAVCGTGTTDDPGLQIYRSHFIWNTAVSGEPTARSNGPNPYGSTAASPQSGTVLGDGAAGECPVSLATYFAWTLGGSGEAGGDVGGGVVKTTFTTPWTQSPGAVAPGTLGAARTY